MNRSILRLAGLVLLIALPACGGGYGSPSGGSGTPNPPPPSPSPSGSSGGTPDVIVTVVSDNGAMSFSPDPVVINAGQRVAWRNGDSIIHTATGISANAFDTREIAPGATSSAQLFGAAGEFAYRCNIHPTMVGTVSVR
jgi:plastocyanin